MNDARSQTIMALFALVPYLLVSWAYMSLTNGNVSDFWKSLAVLLAMRFFFSVIETLGSVLSWRIHGKKIAIKKNLEVMQANNFPKRRYSHDDFLNYLARIEDDPECSTSLKAVAKQMEIVLATCESLGHLIGARMHAAADEALELYSPKAETPSA